MIDLYTDTELVNVNTGSVFVFDVESYPNYFLVGFRDIVNDKHIMFEHSPDVPLDLDKLRWLMWRICSVGFNSNNYDIVMLTGALWGMNTQELKDLSDKIIFQEMRPYKIEKEYGFKIPQFNTVDLMEVAPLKASLKLYGARLHCKTMRELPYPHNSHLTKEQAANVFEYNANDLEQTKLLLVELAPHIELRQDLGKLYGRDFRSLSDAQTAEAIINNEIHRATGHYPRKPQSVITSCRYNVPDYVKFKTPILQRALSIVADSTFTVLDNGSVKMPAEVAKLLLCIGSSTYKMGIGGLHSQEKEVSYYANEDTYLIDRDVASYYPRIVLNQKLFPEHLGEIFLIKYGSIVDRRLAAKKAGNKKISEGLKIAINGIFGKFGNQYSTVYAPNLMLAVTIGGQFSLLMLIEAIEEIGIPVVSGNTDGIVIQCPKSRYQDLLAVIKLWEQQTGFETEETRYKSIHSRDVNNYIAIKEKADEKGRLLSDRLGCKVKGVYSEVGSAQNSVLSKNPETLICSDAVQYLLTRNVPIADTIRSCNDIRRFVAVRTVQGGAEKNGQYLGKAIRWYYAKAQVGAINYCLSGNKVPKSEGAKPLMVLPNSLPSDLNFDYYINESEEMLKDIGVNPRPRSISFF